MDARDDGFTLIELMTVVAIIAILITIALVTFSGARDRAIDARARSLMTFGVQTVRSVASDTRGVAITRDDLAAAEPELHWFDESGTPESAHQDLSVKVGTLSGKHYVILSTHTTNGDCLAVKVDDDQALYQRVAGDVCPASAFDPAFGWVSEWPPR
jgi:type IV pilus assembly protein PilA